MDKDENVVVVGGISGKISTYFEILSHQNKLNHQIRI